MTCSQWLSVSFIDKQLSYGPRKKEWKALPNAEIKEESYLQPRKNPTTAELRLFLLEVDNHCPLCGKELVSRKQKKLEEKKFQIAHIYPNSPTEEQEKELRDLERLGSDSESFENRIALCKDCHGTQDYHTKADEYLDLVKIKKDLLRKTSLHDFAHPLGLEDEISEVVKKTTNVSEEELSALNYVAVPLVNKINNKEILLKTKIQGYVTNYYPYIRDLFRNLEKSSNFNFEVLSMQIRTCFIKMDAGGASQTEIFNAMVDWLNNKTLKVSKMACEAVIAFFVQSCEVFYEIA
jgi:cytochrome c553